MGRRAKNEADEANDKRPVYTAPALEKGLDILELLAREEGPLTASAIVQKLGRSTGEMFRMIQVLERRGFLGQTDQGYALTSRLFQLGLERPPVRNIIEIALPLMRRLSNDTGQSCLLSFASLGESVVVARMESKEQIGFTVRVGYRRPLYMTTSGTTLYAFQPPEIRAEWEALFTPKPSRVDLQAFRASAEDIRAQGFGDLPSNFIDGITDLSAPIMRGDRAAAAIAVPFVRSRLVTASKEMVTAQLLEAAAEISAELVPSDSRV